MKTKQKLFLIAAAASLLAACDPGYTDEYIIDNQSSHNLEFIWSGPYRYYPSEYEQGFDGSYPVDSGKRVTIYYSGGLGHTGFEQITYQMNYYLMGDSVLFVVDGTDTLTFYAADSLSADSPYNFKSDRYTYDELINGSYDAASYASLTFTVDNAMLEAARKKQ